MLSLSNIVRNLISYLVKCEFKSVLMIMNIVHMSLLNYLIIKRWFLGRISSKKRIDDFEKQGYNFNHIAEMNNITKANKKDMSYDFYIRYIMPTVEWRLSAIINKNKNLINKFSRKWRHSLIRKFASYRVWLLWTNRFLYIWMETMKDVLCFLGGLDFVEKKWWSRWGDEMYNTAFSFWMSRI